MKEAIEPHRLLLGAATLGLLLCGRVSPGVLVLFALAAVPLIGTALDDRRLAVGAAVVLVAATFVADSRRQQLTEPAKDARAGGQFSGELTALEPLRPAARGQPRRGLMQHGRTVLLVRVLGEAPRIDAGEIVRATGRIQDATRGAQALRAHATLNAGTVVATGRRRGGVSGAVDSLRRRALSVLGAADGPEGALVAGVVIGQDDRLPAGLRDDMRTAGLTHLTAASGQNVALLAAIAAIAGLVAGISVQARWLLALSLIVVYVPLCGAGPSIVRAAIMGGAMIAAAIAGRPGSRVDALLLAAVLTLAYDPRVAEDLGWQLSFAAVIGIAVMSSRLAHLLARVRIPVPVATVLATTLAATLATAPLLALRVQRPSPWSVPANVLAAPAVPLLMGIGFPAALLGQLAPGPAKALASLARVPAAYLIAVSQRFAEPPTLGHVTPPSPGVMRITALDVGQGDATLIEADGAAVLVDTGLPQAPLRAQLRARRIRRLDALVLTHVDLDHSGGAPELLASVPVGLVIDGRAGVRSELADAIGQQLARCGCRVVEGRADVQVRIGALALATLSPPEPALAPGEETNAHAVVLEVSAYGRSALMTADAESPVLARLSIGPVDLLKVSHHGSADPGLPRMLDRWRPKLAVIEVGAGNRYGHPVAEVLNALASARVPTWRTDRNGAVAFDLGRGTTSVRPERP